MSENGHNGANGAGNGSALPTLAKADFQSDQETRWCPGCGDYAILASVQALMPELGVPPERTVFISGIGCAGRFVYYMDTYGMHGIHGRAPAIATGIAASREDLSVWVVTGDGDSLSIGGNHLIHALRRNVPIKILLFNNQIYGLTKGQYSPTSEKGKITKSTPFGSEDPPFNPLALALGAEASFVARTVDVEKKHLSATLRAAAEHDGAAFIEIYQNCNVFNDGAFDAVRGKGGAPNQIRLEHGEADQVRRRRRARGRPRSRRQPHRRRHRGRRRVGARRPRRPPREPEPRRGAGAALGAAQRPDPDRRPALGRAAGLRPGPPARAERGPRRGLDGRRRRAAALGRHLDRLLAAVANLKFQIAVSLDGFVAGPNQSEEHPLGEGGMAAARLGPSSSRPGAGRTVARAARSTPAPRSSRSRRRTSARS